MKQLVTYNRTVQYLNKVFKRINAEYFNGELEMPTITIQSTLRAYGHVTTSKIRREAVHLRSPQRRRVTVSNGFAPAVVQSFGVQRQSMLSVVTVVSSLNRHKKEGEQFPLLQSLYGLYLCTFTDSGTDTGKAFVNDCVTDLQTYGNTQDVYRQIRKGRLLMGKSVGYARVSSREQNLARQVEALRQYVSEDMIVTDKASGKDFDRAGYQSLKVGIGKLVSGDTLYIKSLDRLGRNKEQAKKELQYFTDIGVRVKVLDLPTTMADISEGQEWILSMINNILIEVLTSISENERQTIKQRQAEGIAVMPIDKATGKRKSSRTGRVVGRPEITYPDNWTDVYTEWRQGKMTAVQAMERLSLKKSSFYKLVKRYEQN